MKEKLSYAVKTSGTAVTLFIFAPSKPQNGEWVKLKRDPADGKWTGEHKVSLGANGYTLTIRAGRPGSDWRMSIQRTGKQPLQRTGALDGRGDGGRVGEISFS